MSIPREMPRDEILGDGIFDKDDLLAIDACLDILRDRFVTAQFFACKKKTDGTGAVIADGFGDWFSRYGQVSMWVKDQEAG
jgi:hypothetical protein